MGIIGEEPVLSRLDRLDNMVRQLEEMRGCNRSPRSSCASTPSSGTLTSSEAEGHGHGHGQGHPSSVDLLSPRPRSLQEKHCRPIDHVMVETQFKGTLIQRLDQVEDRLLKLEEELEEDNKRELAIDHVEKKAHKKGIKQFVKQCVNGKHSQHKAKQSKAKSRD